VLIAQAREERGLRKLLRLHFLQQPLVNRHRLKLLRSLRLNYPGKSRLLISLNLLVMGSLVVLWGCRGLLAQ
jgi:hypothetical protein